jgi:hypothetical protein
MLDVAEGSLAAVSSTGGQDSGSSTYEHSEAGFAAGSRAMHLLKQMGGSHLARLMLRQLCCPITQVSFCD